MLTPPARTRKEAAWFNCKAKTCCYTALVVPSGRDVWRIAHTRDLPPTAFLVYFASPAPRPDAFRLAADDPQGFRLALAKGPTRRRTTPPPCTFLLKTRNGAHRCGLGDGRPLACRTFPADLVAGVVYMRPDAGCTCRDWSLADADTADEAALLALRQDEYREYCRVVAAWNAQVAASPPGTAVDFPAYCAWLLTAYDEITPGNAP